VMGRIHWQCKWSNVTVRKLFSLLVLACMLALPAVGLIGCGGASSEPTGVEDAGDDTENLSEEVEAGEAAIGQEAE
jgi:hypothetical protein